MKQYLSIVLTVVFLAALACGGYAFYHRYMRPMRIAIVADFDSSWVAYNDAAKGTNFAVHRYKAEQIATAPFEKYDIVMLNGMGWRPTEDQLENVRKAASLGTYIHVSAATLDSTNKLNNLPEDVSKKFGAYSGAGGTENLHNALKYLARELKGYKAVIPEPKPRPRNGYFHLDGKLYETIEAYDEHLDNRLVPQPQKSYTFAVLRLTRRQGGRYGTSRKGGKHAGGTIQADHRNDQARFPNHVGGFAKRFRQTAPTRRKAADVDGR